MGILTESLQALAPADTTPVADTLGESFGKGLRSGAYGALGQLNALAGAAGQALGADEFAQGRFGAMRDYQQQAAEAAPQVASLRDVHGAGDALRWGAGLAGQAAPIAAGAIGATALTGGGAVPAALAGTAVMAPLEVGDVVQRQIEQGKQASLRDAILPGLGSAALQGIVPGLGAAKAMGKVASRGALRELAAIPEQAALAGGGEAVKQLGSGQQLNPEAVGEAAAAGGVMGAPFAALGAAGAARGRVGEAVKGAADRVGELAGAAREKAAGAIEGAKEAVAVPEGLKNRSQEAADAIAALTERVKDRASSATDAVAQGFPAVDLKSFAGKAGDEFTSMLRKADEETIPKVKAWGEKLLNDAGLDEGKRAEVAAAMQDLGSDANRAVIAAVKKAQHLGQAATEQAKGLYEATKAWVDRSTTKGDAAQPKKSEDFSGIRKTILDTVGPALAETHPELMKSEQARGQVADSLRMFIEQVAKREPGKLDSNQVARLIDTFGEKTTEVLDKVFAATRGEDRGAAENFFGALNQIREMQRRDTSLTDVMAKNLKDEHQSEYTTSDLRELARHLKDWVSRTSDGSEATRFHDQRINDMLAQTFDKPEAVRDALLKSTKEEQAVFAKDALETDEHGNPVNPDAVDYTDVLTEGGPQRSLVSKKLVTSPEAHRAEFGNEGQAERLIREAKARDGGLDARWMSAEDFHAAEGTEVPADAKGKGYVVAERMAGSDKLTPEQAAAFKFDSSKGDRRSNASVIDAGEGVKLDAMKLGRQRNGEELPWNASDDKSSMVRLQRQVLENAAALQDALGRKFKIPDEAVVARRGGKDITWGSIKGLKQSTETRAGQSVEDSAERARRLKKELDAVEKQMLDGDAGTRRELRPKWEQLREQLDEAFSADSVSREMERRGQQELPPDANIHELEALGKVEPHRVNMDGTPVSHTPRKSPKEILAQREAKKANAPEPERKVLPIPKSEEAQVRAAAEAAAREAMSGMDPPTSDTFSFRYGGHELQARQIRPGVVEVLDSKGKVLFPAKGSTPDPKVVAAKKAAFIEKARSGDADLVKTLSTSDDAKGLQRAAEALAKEPPSPELAKVTDAINKRLGELVKDPSTAYGMQLDHKYSLQSAQPGNTSTSRARADTAAYLDRVLGPSVDRAFASILHAGEFNPADGQRFLRDTIRISVHALDPLSVAHHEALHAWFKQLSDAGLNSVMKPLLQAADSVYVRKQLERLLANEPSALSQLADAEERVAYMHQFYSTGQLKVGPETKTVLHKIADFFRKVLGIWSNDERAMHIMDYFERGGYKADMGDRSAIARATLEPGTNKVLKQLQTFTEPLLHMADSLASAGSARLRDTGVPALRELATIIKATGREEGQDAGFIPAARIERTQRMNAFAEALRPYSKDQISAALEGLQGGATPTDVGARSVMATVKKVLRDTRDYMLGAGVDVSDLGPDYFPRVYDTSYITSNQKAFTDVLRKHGVANADEVMRKIIGAEGSDMMVQVTRPGMQHLKERSLSFVPDADLAPFMRKDLYHIMSSYVTQATRRAEWARRLGDNNEQFHALLAEAVRQGATKDDIKLARDYVMGVDGTLGDDISPGLRRLQGNMIVYQNIRLLPLAIFSSIIDPMGILVRGGTVGDAWSTFKRGIKEIRHNFKDDPKFDAQTELAETLGVIDDAMLTHTLGGLYSQGMVSDKARKINDTFFRYNMMEGFNRSMRVGATQAAIKFIARHADGTASQHSARWLRELNLEPGKVPMKPDGSLDLSNEAVRSAINTWVDGAVLRPDAADKPVWMNDPHYAVFAHLKQFVYSFHETILKRVMHEVQAGNYKPAMALASYVPVMLAADLGKGLIQGGGSQPDWKDKWGPGDYLWSATQRAGLLGVGQFAADAIGNVERGGYGVGALVGPTIEQLGDAIKVMGGREQFKHFALHSMPANALYASAVAGGGQPDPTFAE